MHIDFDTAVIFLLILLGIGVLLYPFAEDEEDSS